MMGNVASSASAAAKVLAEAAGTDQWKPVLRAIRRLRRTQSVHGLGHLESEFERMQYLLAGRSLDLDHGQENLLVERYRQRLEQLLIESLRPDELNLCAQLLQETIQSDESGILDFTVVPRRDPGKVLQIGIQKPLSRAEHPPALGQRQDLGSGAPRHGLAAACAYSLLIESAVGKNWPILSDSSSRLPASSLRRSDMLQSLVAPPEKSPPDKIFGRRDTLKELQELVEYPDGRIHVISGPSGVGKSAIASSLAAHARERGITVWWVRCGSGYTHAAMSAIAFLLGANPRDLAEARAGRRSLPDLVWSMLETAEAPWLLVIDDCDQADASTDGNPAAWARPSRRGMVVIATRASSELKRERRTRQHVLYEISRECGIELLAEVASAIGPRNQARQLASLLGGRPLTLSLTAAYLNCAGASAKSFMEYYRRRCDQAADSVGDQPQATPDFLVDGILDTLESQGIVQARPILEILAHFASGIMLPDIILRSLKLGEFGLYPFSDSSRLQTDIERGLEALQGAGLLEKLDPASYSENFSVTLVQLNPAIARICREQLARSLPPKLRAVRVAAAASLNAAVIRYLDSPEREWAGCALLASHIHSLLFIMRDSRPPETAFEQIADAACSVADFLLITGAYQDAENLARNVHEISGMLTKDHPLSLETGLCLANTLMARGRLGEAQEMINHVLGVHQRVLGPGHPKTLRVLEKLALCLRDQGRLREAEMALRQVVSGRQRLLSDDHVGTLQALASLSTILWAQGKIGETERSLRRVVEGRQRILNPEDSDLIEAISDLANVLRDVGRLREAEKALRRVLEVRERTLGKDDPDTLDVLVELAKTLRVQGRPYEAEIALKRVFEVRERTLGKDDPDTLDVLVELAETLREQGKPEDARSRLQYVFDHQVWRLGANHPDLLNTQVSLAAALRDLGEWDQAEKELRSAVASYGETVGPEHPITLCAMHDLSAVLQDIGRFDEAEELCKHVLDLREWTLGPNHPETLDTLANMGCLLRSRGALREAQDAISHALKGYEDLLGSGHPTCLTIRSNLAGVLYERGMLEEAKEMQQTVLADRIRVLGDKHPDTLIARMNVAAGLMFHGNLGEAEKLLQDVLDVYSELEDSAQPGRVIALYNLAIVYRRRWQLKEAEEIIREVVRTRTDQFGPDHPDTLLARNELVRVLKGMGRSSEAAEEYENILQGAERFVVEGCE